MTKKYSPIVIIILILYFAGFILGVWNAFLSNLQSSAIINFTLEGIDTNAILLKSIFSNSLIFLLFILLNFYLATTIFSVLTIYIKGFLCGYTFIAICILYGIKGAFMSVVAILIPSVIIALILGAIIYLRIRDLFNKFKNDNYILNIFLCFVWYISVIIVEHYLHYIMLLKII